MTAITTTPAPASEGHLIPTFRATIGGASVLCCDARALHAYLENGDLFANWIKARIEKYGFQQDQDFAIALENSKAKRGGHNRRDYHLTLDMAKELAMVENNERGRQARRYFIECERRALEAAGQTVEPPRHETLLPSEQQTLKEIAHRRVAALPSDVQGKALAEIWSRVQNKFRVARYSQLPRVQLADAIAYVMTLELRCASGAGGDGHEPRVDTRERISERDMAAIRYVIGIIADRMHFSTSWTQGLWRYLRAALDNPAPNPWYVDQLPHIERLLTRALAVAESLRHAEAQAEEAALRHLLGRHPKALEETLAELREQSQAMIEQARLEKLDPPPYFRDALAAIADRMRPMLAPPRWSSAERLVAAAR